VLLDADHKLIGYLEPCPKPEERTWIGDDFVQGVERLLVVPTRVVWAGRYPNPAEFNETLYDAAESVAQLRAPQHGFIGRYILNHDRRAYVDKATVLENGHRDRIHPLPVLTAVDTRCCGELREGRTVGDATLVGSWAGDRISLSGNVPAGFELLKFDLVQN
jgi:hypothetical protein